MPFIVTTTRPARPGDFHAAMSEAAGIDTDSISRQAVATLEERRVFDATEWAGKDVGDNSQFVHPALVLRRYTPQHEMEVATVLFLHDGRVSSGHFTHAMLTPDVPLIPESGGTITLPDGTVIEVEAIGWSALARAAGRTAAAVDAGLIEPATPGKGAETILAAFNAREASHA
jgi:hypothetical protein